MKRILVLLLSCVAAVAAAPPAPDPAGPVRTVYLLPMGFGFDQFLANHLRATGLFEVVTDPKLAETVLTDRIGAGFEAQLKQLYGEKAPPPTEEKEGDQDTPPAVAAMARSAPVGMMSTFGRGKGNLFLVDIDAARVIWSTYERPVGSDPAELDRAAQRVAQRMKKDMLKMPRSARAAAPPPAEAAPPPPPAPPEP